MTAEQKLGVGIIGIGWVAHEHIKAWNNNPSCAVVALASHSQDNAAAAQQQHGLVAARIYTDWTDLIGDEHVDVVVAQMWGEPRATKGMRDETSQSVTMREPWGLGAARSRPRLASAAIGEPLMVA